MSEADKITAEWNKARPVLASYFHPDSYLIVRIERVPDGSGGHTDVEAVVESGKCSLSADGRLGFEGANGPLTLSVNGYTVELPITTGLDAADILYVNSRKFNVTDVQKGGDHDLFATAHVEEAS